MPHKKRVLKIKNQRLKWMLKRSLQLQSHYAEQLNMYDGSKRLKFPTIQSWELRLMLADVKGEKGVIDEK